MTKGDTYKAALLGFACADALGATVEFMSPEEIKRDIGMHRNITGGGWLRLDPGEITDDTEMTLCVARSLVECRGVDYKNIWTWIP
jgi:ADP-ribosyl-[dinitrogen reductase] hydrolase